MFCFIKVKLAGYPQQARITTSELNQMFIRSEEDWNERPLYISESELKDGTKLALRCITTSLPAIWVLATWPRPAGDKRDSRTGIIYARCTVEEQVHANLSWSAFDVATSSFIKCNISITPVVCLARNADVCLCVHIVVYVV